MGWAEQGDSRGLALRALRPLLGHHRCLLTLCQTAERAREMLYPPPTGCFAGWTLRVPGRAISHSGKVCAGKRTSGGEEPGFLSVGFQILFLIVNTRLSSALYVQRSGSVCVCVCVCERERERRREGERGWGEERESLNFNWSAMKDLTV